MQPIEGRQVIFRSLWEKKPAPVVPAEFGEKSKIPSSVMSRARRHSHCDRPDGQWQCLNHDLPKHPAQGCALAGISGWMLRFRISDKAAAGNISD